MVVVGDVVGHQRAAVGQPQAAHRAVVLDRDRHARERALIAGFDLLGRRERALAVDLDESVQAWGSAPRCAASEISTSSREDTSPERTIAASSVAGRNISSLSITALLLMDDPVWRHRLVCATTCGSIPSIALRSTARRNGAYLEDSCDDMRLPTRQPGRLRCNPAGSTLNR